MQHATLDTVLGDFDNAEFMFHGVTSTFFKYVYAIALHDVGRRPEAIHILADSVKRGGGRDVLLAQFNEQSGDSAGASEAYRALAAINPDDPAVKGRRPSGIATQVQSHRSPCRCASTRRCSHTS